MAEAYSVVLTDSFEAQRPTYEAFTRNLADLVRRLVEDEGIDCLAIEHRTKSVESFAEKIERPEKAQKYEAVDEVTDISGVRIVAYLREDCDKICSIIKTNFIIDDPNSTNKEDLIDPDRFGYLSVHYVISYNKERTKLPEFARFSGLKGEIQVRTILQHTWAAIDWKLRYKADQEVPRTLKRRLYRISALLEAADEDFSQVGIEVDSLRQAYERSVKKGDFAVSIDRDSLEIFINRSSIVRDLEKVAVKCGFNISPAHPESRNPFLSLLLTLEAAKVHYLNELEDILKDKQKNEENLSLIYTLWHTVGMPHKLVMGISGVIRLLVILSMERNYARDVVEAHPFGPTVQNAVLASLS